MERFTVKYYTDGNPHPDGQPVVRYVFGYPSALACAVARVAQEKQPAFVFDREGRLFAALRLTSNKTQVYIAQLSDISLAHPALAPKPEPAPKPPTAAQQFVSECLLSTLAKRTASLAERIEKLEARAHEHADEPNVWPSKF